MEEMRARTKFWNCTTDGGVGSDLTDPGKPDLKAAMEAQRTIRFALLRCGGYSLQDVFLCIQLISVIRTLL